jgi:hypothetical protein
MNLSPSQFHHLLKRFPSFELSYETISHKKVSNENYNLAIAIPNGIKYFLWFSFYENKDVCYLMELNRDKKICKVSIVNTIFHNSLSIGTILYGTIIDVVEPTTQIVIAGLPVDKKYFVIEDIYYYKGISLHNICFGEKLGFIYNLFEKMIVQQFPEQNNYGLSCVITLPVMWWYKNTGIEPFDTPSYLTKYIQYRSLTKILPYLNVLTKSSLNCFTKKIIQGTHGSTNTTNTFNTIISNREVVKPSFNTIDFVVDFKKPQYKKSSVFKVIPDLQFDIYHLLAYNNASQTKFVYYNVAYIPNYKTSIFMNSLFRNIRENKNIDYIEESDSEDDFENINLDKYVNLNKYLLMECVFNFKFKKWVPIKIAEPKTKIVNINYLAKI